MIDIIILAAIALVIRCFYLLRYPLGPCWCCRAHPGVNSGSNSKRWGVCKACGGTKTRQRFGARAVHRFWWSVLGRTLHEKRKEKIGRAREKGGYPEL